MKSFFNIFLDIFNLIIYFILHLDCDVMNNLPKIPDDEYLTVSKEGL